MKMLLSVAIFSRFIARRRGLAAAGFSARLVGWAHVIVDGRRGNEECRVRQDKAPAPIASIADGKPLSAHCFSGGWMVPCAMP
jgi:hypothetical protein